MMTPAEICQAMLASLPAPPTARRTEHSMEIRLLVIKQHDNGHGYKAIAKQTLLPVSTVRNIIVKLTKHDLLRICRDRPLVDSLVESIIVREVMHSRKASRAALLQTLHEHHHVIVSEKTVRQILHKAGLHGRAACKKPFIDEQEEPTGVCQEVHGLDNPAVEACPVHHSAMFSVAE
ncbi:TPA: hypothetical protein N0F65_006042 [Lagenidium giganteum]|uniref:Transposase Tc1-like domain-containing protein n=1 Tax=Lagenidium giganteum TaxID=4803 RepID=A0AAV2Z8P2_9STRA|nr:TPA: hypothetical protein N0F65_006042 [Lagenidium giganteum]